jgi:hypothetical protein
MSHYRIAGVTAQTASNGYSSISVVEVDIDLRRYPELQKTVLIGANKSAGLPDRCPRTVRRLVELADGAASGVEIITFSPFRCIMTLKNRDHSHKVHKGAEQVLLRSCHYKLVQAA